MHQCYVCGEYHPDGRTKEARDCKKSQQEAQACSEKERQAGWDEEARLRSLDHDRELKQRFGGEDW